MTAPNQAADAPAPALRHNAAYRADIDGLRAFSIVAVILFHFFPNRLPGGFAGVDVFFVISGFLISRILFEGLNDGTFRYKDFYRRRIQRIFPALIAVLAASLVVGWFMLLPDEWKMLGKHVFVGAGFVSNLALARERLGYFDSPEKPLLNLWSLGIEEQFYIVWPLLLAWSWKLRRRALPLFLVCVVSFGLNVGYVYGLHSQAAFYFPAMRFWELALGALLAYAMLFQPKLAKTFHRPRVAAMLSLGAVCLLTASLLFLDRERDFPGAWALLPTLGAALVIASGPQAWFNRWALSSRAAVFVGLISYPLYLWHWPILVFGKLFSPLGHLRLRNGLALILLAFLLSWLTWRFIERPLRHHRSSAVPWALAGGVALLGALGLICYASVAPRLSTPDAQHVVDAAGDWNYAPPGRNYGKHSGFAVGSLGSGPGQVLFVGDSHMEQYYDRIKLLMDGASGKVWTSNFATYGACPPIPRMTRIDSPVACEEFFEFASQQAAAPQTKVVVFCAFWERYFGYALGGNKMSTVYRSGDAREAKPGLAVAVPAFADFGAFLKGLRAQGKRTFVILSNPTSVVYDPHSMLSRVTGRIVRRDFDRKDLEFSAPIIDLLRSTAEDAGATVLDPIPYLCGEATCPTLDENRLPVYKDENHVRSSFLARRATFIDQIFNP